MLHSTDVLVEAADTPLEEEGEEGAPTPVKAEAAAVEEACQGGTYCLPVPYEQPLP